MTLPITVVIVFFVSFLATAIIAMTSLSIKIKINQRLVSEHQIILENIMYEQLNKFSDLDKSGNDFLIEDKWLMNIKEEEGIYQTQLRHQHNFTNIVLFAKIAYDSEKTTYQIKAWGNI